MIKLANFKNPCFFKLEKLRLQSSKRIEFEYADYIKGKKSQTKYRCASEIITSSVPETIRIKQVA